LEAGHDKAVEVEEADDFVPVAVVLDATEELADVVIVEVDPDAALLRTNPHTALLVEAGLIAFFM